MQPRVLYLGGSGEVSTACVAQSVRLGHDVTIANRGSHAAPSGVKQVIADVRVSGWERALGKNTYDVVCQFLGFDAGDVDADALSLADRCDQFVLISSASVYQRPNTPKIIDENTPVGNAFSEYARNKIAAEVSARKHEDAGTWRATIVRPSHTYREFLPCPLIPFDHFAWRAMQGKPNLCHGDGSSLWAVMHAEDFASSFCALLGNERAMGETIQICSEQSAPWREILQHNTNALGVSNKVVFRSVEELIAEKPDWEGALLGDMASSVRFDCTKIKSIAGHAWSDGAMKTGFAQAAILTKQRLQGGFQPDPKLDRLIDRLTSKT